MPNSDDVTKVFTPEETATWLLSLDKRFGSAGVWCETPDGRLIIVKSPYKRYWAIPGGVIDAGETPKQAAIRETKEEVGITLDPDTLEFRIVTSRVIDGLGYNYQFTFWASVTQEQIDAMVLQPEEITESALVSPGDITSSQEQLGRLLSASIYAWANGVTGYSEEGIHTTPDLNS